MTEVDWVPPVLALVLGLVGGAIVAWLQNDDRVDGGADDARQEDLRREKDRLLQALRDLQDLGATEVTAEERAALEQRAAEVLRELEGPAASPSRSKKKEKAARREAAAAAVPAATGLSPEARGMLKGGLLVAFVALAGFVLTQFSAERTEGMSITGNIPTVDSVEVEAPVPEAGETGGAVPGVPPDLRPKASPAVDAARARVATDPGTLEHWVELGYALIDAEGWIDAWQVGEEIDSRVPGHPEGLIIRGIVRVAMGMEAEAAALMEQALAKQPDHPVALSYAGMLALRRGEKDAAIEIWTRARDLAPTAEDRAAFEELLAMAEAGVVPGGSSDHPPHDAPHPEGVSRGGGAAGGDPPGREPTTAN